MEDEKNTRNKNLSEIELSNNEDSEEPSNHEKHSFPLVSLFISHLNYRVIVKKGIPFKKKTKEIHILKDLDLNIKIGSFNTILGPSGSGKTTLLNFLAIRVVPNSKPEGQYIVNGKEAYMLKSFRRSISYILQEDILIPHLTVRETLLYAAKFKLPTSLTEKEKINKVDSIIERLGLKNCENTYVGEPGIKKGISGGEKKRLSIGVELLSSPTILFVDEPTTGLDSVLAYDVIKILYDIVVNDKVTVIATIHQPSSEMFKFFGNILAMKDGKIVTYVERDEIIEVFRNKGMECGELENPSEFILKCCVDRQSKNKEALEEMMKEHSQNSKKQIEKEKKN